MSLDPRIPERKFVVRGRTEKRPSPPGENSSVKVGSWSFAFLAPPERRFMSGAVVVIFGLLWIAAGLVAVIQLFRRKWKSLGIWAGVAFVSFVICMIATSQMPPSTTTSSSGGSDSSSNPKIARQVDAANAPAPTPRPLSRQEQKRDFLKTVDESLSGARIAGNPYKFVGKRVDLHCTVGNIPQEDFFNATCGTDDDGSPVTLVIETNTKDLEPGQTVRVIGTVAQPMEGNNAMGGEGHFPTIEASFME